MIITTCRYRFSASHRLHAAQLSERENLQLYGKCNNPFGHGHDYVLYVSVSGKIDSKTGMQVRLTDLHKLVREEVLSDFEHGNFNTDIPEFATSVPTTENIARVIADRLSRKWNVYFGRSEAKLAGIRIEETDRNSFEVVVAQSSQLVPTGQRDELAHV